MDIWSNVEYRWDYITWLNTFDVGTKYSTEQLQEMQQDIIATNNCAAACFFAMEFGHQVHLMQKVILDNSNAKYAVLFACHVPNCDIQAMQKIVMQSQKVKYVCHFACFVAGAKRKPLEKLILGSKQAHYAHLYMKHGKCHVSKVKDLIFKSKKPRYLFELAKHLTDPTDIEKVEDLIIQSGSVLYMRLLAERVPGINIDKLEQAVLATNDTKAIKQFARKVKDSKMKRFLLL
jgi:hypothetical protein